MTTGEDLYRLQTLDSEGDEKRRRLAEVEAALEENQALEKARQAEEEAASQVHEWSRRQRDLELRIQGLTEKSERTQQRLYGGTVTNPKELADLQAERDSLRRRQQKLEDKLLEAMIELEDAEKAHAQAKARFDEIHTQWEVEQANLKAEREDLQQRLSEIENARAKLLPKIDASDLATYRSLRRRKGGQVVVQVRDGACEGCGVAVSPGLEWKLREGELAQCSNCERIIVRL